MIGTADLRRQHVGETVQRQRRLVRDHPGLIGPEPSGDQSRCVQAGAVYPQVWKPGVPFAASTSDGAFLSAAGSAVR